MNNSVYCRYVEGCCVGRYFFQLKRPSQSDFIYKVTNLNDPQQFFNFIKNNINAKLNYMFVSSENEKLISYLKTTNISMDKIGDSYLISWNNVQLKDNIQLKGIIKNE